MLLRLPDGTCDTETGVVKRGTTTDTLTAKERELLDYLARRAGQVVSTEELLREVWGYAASAETRAVFHTCRRLRAKIEPDPSAPTLVLAERSVGYKLAASVAVAPVVAAPAPALKPPPAERNRFFGREGELDGVAARYARGDRLVTLVGVGGMGKTRLATHFALTRWQGPAAFCDLVAARTEADVVGALGASVGAPASLEDPAATVRDRLGAGLLVVDNAESALDVTARWVGACLDAAPELRVLVTSRAPLGIPGESRVALFGLEPASAVALVEARAEGERLDGAALDAVVARLGGIPLALELAAARTALVGPGALRALLEERGGQEAWLRVLADPAGGERHGQMIAVLDGTWAILPPDARAVAGQLAVFEGGFSLEAAEVVLPGATAVIGVLLRAALLRRVGDARYTMLPPVQAYARGTLTREELTRARDRHADWALAYFSTPSRTLAERREERSNLVTACEWAIATRRADVGRLIEVGWKALNATGGMRRGAELAAAAATIEGLPAGDRIRIHRAAMFALRRAGELQQALVAAAHLAAAAREIEDHETLAQALSVEGYMRYVRGEHGLARAALEEAHRWSEEGGPVIRAAVKSRLATLRRAEGRHAEALGLFEEAAELYPVGTPDRVSALCRVAELRQLNGDLAGARRAAEEAARLHTGEVHHGLDVLAARMVIAAEQGELAEAEGFARSLRALSAQVGDTTTEARALVALSATMFETGRSAEALEHARAAAAIRLGAIRHRAVALMNLGWIAGRLDEPGADAHLAEAEALLAEAPAVSERRELQTIRADLALHRGDLAGARAWLQRGESEGFTSLRLEARVRARLDA